MGYPKSSWYRHRSAPSERAAPIPQALRHQPHALTGAERAAVVALLSQPRSADLSVQKVFWQALEEGVYVASMRTWYRVAAAERLSGDRRRLSTHPPNAIPELEAAGPNQVWSWDITRIPIRSQKTPLHLYLIEDVFSRKCVGWRLEHREHDVLAAELIEDTVAAEQAQPHTLHADGGPSMTSTVVKTLLADLGIAHSKSRPRVSNDNPFSEALFKTLKYDLAYPQVFDGYFHARTWIEAWVQAYNTSHHHSGLAGFTPASVHDGTWPAQARARQALLDAHHARVPGRYRRPPVVQTPAGTVWINKPAPEVSQAA